MMNQPDDIVVEILLRLPVKSLLRFRCVCKNWCSLTKTPQFIDRHLALQRARGDDHLLVKRMVKPSDSTDAIEEYVLNCYGVSDSLSVLNGLPDFDFDTQSYTGTPLDFAGYVNGIVCLTDYDTVSLLNPALREFRTLPARPFGYLGGFWVSTGAIGFGFDDTTDDYKVVRYIKYTSLSSSGRGHTEAEVYSMRTKSWKGLGNIPKCYSISSSCSPIFFNGCVHWLAWSDVDNDIILGFNMSTELFQEMQLPDDLKHYEFNRLKGLFVVDKSTIALVAFTENAGWVDRRGDFVNVWVMKEYCVKESWIKQYSMTPSLKLEKPLSFWKRDKLVLVTTDGELVYYDLPTGELHLLWEYDTIEGEHSVAKSFGMLQPTARRMQVMLGANAICNAVMKSIFLGVDAAKRVQWKCCALKNSF